MFYVSVMLGVDHSVGVIVLIFLAKAMKRQFNNDLLKIRINKFISMNKIM